MKPLYSDSGEILNIKLYVVKFISLVAVESHTKAGPPGFPAQLIKRYL